MTLNESQEEKHRKCVETITVNGKRQLKHSKSINQRQLYIHPFGAIKWG